MSEAQISRAIMDYLAATHIFAVRMNAGTQVLVSNGKRRAIHGHAPGTADILAFPIKHYLDGDFMWWKMPMPLWIEVKTAKGKQSEMQKSFQVQVEAEGHKYVLARSVDDVIAALK